MKKFLAITGALLLLALAAYCLWCLLRKPPVVTVCPPSPVGNLSRVVETAYMVATPAAVKGDTLIFQGFSTAGKGIYIHFPLGSPCDETDILGTDGAAPQCIVTQSVSAGSKIQFAFYADDIPPKAAACKTCPTVPTSKSICRTCCQSGCKVVIVNPGPGHPLLNLPSSGSGEYPAIEVLIDETGTGAVTARTAAPYDSQPVTWFRSGTVNPIWHVKFEKASPCTEGYAFTNSGEKGSTETCTIKAAADTTYNYTITVGTLNKPEVEKGFALLYIAKTPPKAE